MKKKRLHLAIGALIVINLVLAFFAYEKPAPDLSYMNFGELSNYFAEVSHDKGGVYAFSILGKAPLPPNVDIHLLGHVIGNILYTQEGPEAISLCTPDFRNACSHTIVIGTLLEHGPESFGDIANLCRRAPGGSGAYTMCFHGLGHGVLAYNDYELPEAVRMCERTGSTRWSGEYIECVGGTIMEMISGVHDRAIWQEKAKKYFKKEDPLYPCSADFMPTEAKGICYTYLTPHLLQTAGASLARPTPADFEKAFRYCDPLTNALRSICYGSFGKEFIALAQDRDIRLIESMTDSQIETVLDWCELAGKEGDVISCTLSAVNSLYWGGENDPGVSLRFCEGADKRGKGKVCTEELIQAVNTFVPNLEYRTDICARVGEDYQALCKERLL